MRRSCSESLPKAKHWAWIYTSTGYLRTPNMCSLQWARRQPWFWNQTVNLRLRDFSLDPCNPKETNLTEEGEGRPRGPGVGPRPHSMWLSMYRRTSTWNSPTGSEQKPQIRPMAKEAISE